MALGVPGFLPLLHLHFGVSTGGMGPGAGMRPGIGSGAVPGMACLGIIAGYSVEALVCTGPGVYLGSIFGRQLQRFISVVYKLMAWQH